MADGVPFVMVSIRELFARVGPGGAQDEAIVGWTYEILETYLPNHIKSQARLTEGVAIVCRVVALDPDPFTTVLEAASVKSVGVDSPEIDTTVYRISFRAPDGEEYPVCNCNTFTATVFDHACVALGWDFDRPGSSSGDHYGSTERIVVVRG